MYKIYITEEDELLIRKIVGDRGLDSSETIHKWAAIRLALAVSLRNQEPPGENFDNGTKEYNLDQVTGFGQNDKDFTDSIKAMLSVYHKQDLFKDNDVFLKLLRRHIRRGFGQIRQKWLENLDFYEYLFQELFSGENQNDRR